METNLALMLVSKQQRGECSLKIRYALAVFPTQPAASSSGVSGLRCELTKIQFPPPKAAMCVQFLRMDDNLVTSPFVISYSFCWCFSFSQIITRWGEGGGVNNVKTLGRILQRLWRILSLHFFLCFDFFFHSVCVSVWKGIQCP